MIDAVHLYHLSFIIGKLVEILSHSWMFGGSPASGVTAVAPLQWDGLDCLTLKHRNLRVQCVEPY